MKYIMCKMNHFSESLSKAQVELVVVGHLVQTNTETFRRAPELPVEDFKEISMNFKTDLMILKHRIRTVRDTVLQENKKIEGLIGICVESMTKSSRIEKRLKFLTRQQEEYNWDFQSNPLQEYIDKAYHTTKSPL